MPEARKVFEPDATTENADWTKQSWDLPPYKSPEFFAAIGEEHLPAFREGPAYKGAVAAGLILDDEWVADWITAPQPQAPPAKAKAKDRRYHVHIH